MIQEIMYGISTDRGLPFLAERSVYMYLTLLTMPDSCHKKGE